MAAIELFSTPLYQDANLLHYYRLEDLTDSKGAIALTNNGAAPFNTAVFNNGVDLGANNTAKYISTTSNLGINGGASTFCFWGRIQTEVASGHYTLFQQLNCASANFDGFYIRYYNNTPTNYIQAFRIRSGVALDSFTYNISLGTTNFHHFALTYDNTNLILYLDGANVGSVGSSGNGISGGATGTWLGLEVDNNSGSIIAGTYASMIYDDFAVFSRALTAGEVNSLYTGNWSIPNKQTTIQTAVHRAANW